MAAGPIVVVILGQAKVAIAAKPYGPTFIQLLADKKTGRRGQPQRVAAITAARGAGAIHIKAEVAKQQLATRTHLGARQIAQAGRIAGDG